MLACHEMMSTETTGKMRMPRGPASMARGGGRAGACSSTRPAGGADAGRRAAHHLISIREPAFSERLSGCAGPATVRFLADHPIVLQIGSTVFVHGGVLPQHAEYGVERINAETREWMLGRRPQMPQFLGGRDAVVWAREYSTGRLHILTPLVAAIPAINVQGHRRGGAALQLHSPTGGAGAHGQRRRAHGGGPHHSGARHQQRVRRPGLPHRHWPLAGLR